MSFPAKAEVLVNWVPANCMPSPESPQNRTVAASSSTTGFEVVVVAMILGGFLRQAVRRSWGRRLAMVQFGN